VAFTQELTFQEGKSLSRISDEGEGSTELVEYNHTTESSPDHQVYMASLRSADDDESELEYDAKLLADVSADEHKADAPQDEIEEYRRIRRLKNAKRATLKRPPIREDLKVSLYQSQEADNTFITSDGSLPYNSSR
jgi:hypothetical protein